MRVAVVDIGTNSTRLLIADVAPDGALTQLKRESIVTRLGDRVDASGRVTTVSGMGKGSTEDAVKQTYPGRIEVQRHPYVPTGHYLVYVPADPALAHLSMIFETDGRVVTTFRAGMKGAVAQIEGCS